MSKSPAYSTDQQTAAHSRGHFFAPAVQTKLTVNKPGDQFEQEADAVADQVMRMPDTQGKHTAEADAQPAGGVKPVEIQRFVQSNVHSGQNNHNAQQGAGMQSHHIDTSPAIHRSVAPAVQAKSDQGNESELPERDNDRENGAVLRKEKTHVFAPPSTNGINGNTTVQRACVGCEAEEKEQQEGEVMREDTGGAADSGGQTAPPIVQDVLSSGSSQPMDVTTSDFMGTRFGQDFSDVRIHNDSRAAESAQSINALAYTSGNDIVFGAGQYAPETDSGKHLLAHELTHTVQQGGGVQRKEGVVQRAKGTSPQKTLFEATPAELAASKSDAGYISRGAKGQIEFHIAKLKTEKYYITKEEVAWLKKDKILMPKGKRNTKQKEVWLDKVTKGGTDKLKSIAGKENADNGKILKFTLNTGSKKDLGIVGTFEQIANELLVPFWDFKGKPKRFDIEHMVDWQIAGARADVIENIILLQSGKNRSIGTKVEKVISKNLSDISDAYAENFKNVPKKGIKDKYDSYIDSFDFEGEDLNIEDYYYYDEIATEKGEGNPYNEDFITIKEEKIPPGYFLLTTSDGRAGYILKYNIQNEKVGALTVTAKNNKQGKLTELTIKYGIDDKKKIIKQKDWTAETIKFDDKSVNERDRYVVENERLNRFLGPKLKDLFVDGFSPVGIPEDNIAINGFDVKADGKVNSTLNVLKGVDISFYIHNNEFGIQAEILLAQIGKNLPKPFKIDYCSIIIAANSQTGLSIAGGLGFSIEKFGQGQIFATAGNKVAFDGSFNFDSKYFKPAEINVSYENGAWSIGGTIGIQEGVVKGIKKATLKVGYSKDVFSAAGEAELEVPGIDKVKLGAEYDEAGGFKFFAGVDLKKMPGIKSGSVQITVITKGEEGLKLGITGEAEPDFPSVPNLSPKLRISYQDGVFDVRAGAKYKKGRFEGALEVGITNRAVDEKGMPKSEVSKPKDVVVFGYGELVVDIFKGNKGKVSIRLTPEKDVLVAGGIHLENLSPFGDGIDFKKEIAQFPTIQIPIFGVPGVNIFFEISGGAYFTFNWQPLILKRLDVNLQETKIDEMESAQIDITGSVGSIAKAEAYMEITASLGAKVLIAAIKGSLSGSAGVGVEAEAGGDISASWNHEKGLQLKEIIARVAINPYAVFRLKGSLKVYLDLWLTTVTLYYKEWLLAEEKADLSGLSLNIQLPIRFNEDGDMMPVGYDQMTVEQPKFSGEQGKKVLSKGINGDEEPSRDKEKVRAQIRTDMRNSVNDEDFTPSKYSKAMQKKYAQDPEMKEFVRQSVEEEARLMEYEQFDQLKRELRAVDAPAKSKMPAIMFFSMFHEIDQADIEAFKMQLIQEELEKIRLEEERKRAEQLAAEQKLAEQKAAELKAAQEQAAKEKAAKEKAAKLKAAREKAARQKAAREKEARERAAQEKATQEKKPGMPDAGKHNAELLKTQAAEAEDLKAQELEVQAAEAEVNAGKQKSGLPKPKKEEPAKTALENKTAREQTILNRALSTANTAASEGKPPGEIIPESPPDIPKRNKDFKTESGESGTKQQTGANAFFQPKPVSDTTGTNKGINDMPGPAENPSFGNKNLQIEFALNPAKEAKEPGNKTEPKQEQINAAANKPALKYGETPPDTDSNTELIDLSDSGASVQSESSNSPQQFSFPEENQSLMET